MKNMIHLDWQSEVQNENTMIHHFTTRGWKTVKSLSIRNVYKDVMKWKPTPLTGV